MVLICDERADTYNHRMENFQNYVVRMMRLHRLATIGFETRVDGRGTRFRAYDMTDQFNGKGVDYGRDGGGGSATMAPTGYVYPTLVQL